MRIDIKALLAMTCITSGAILAPIATWNMPDNIQQYDEIRLKAPEEALQVLERFLQALVDHNESVIRELWHGGEVTLHSPDDLILNYRILTVGPCKLPEPDPPPLPILLESDLVAWVELQINIEVWNNPHASLAVFLTKRSGYWEILYSIRVGKFADPDVFYLP